jgi:hypothetical protein
VKRGSQVIPSQEAQKELLEVLFHNKGKAWLVNESLASFYHKCFRSAYFQMQLSMEQNVLKISTTYLQSMFLGSKMFSRFLQQEHVSIEQNLQDIFTTNA